VITEIQRLNAFQKNHPDAELTGFFDRSDLGSYRVVLLASVPTGFGRKAEAASFVANNAAELVRKARKSGWRIGRAPEVQRLCNSARRARRPRL
jgi:hypothetical protein